MTEIVKKFKLAFKFKKRNATMRHEQENSRKCKLKIFKKIKLKMHCCNIDLLIFIIYFTNFLNKISFELINLFLLIYLNKLLFINLFK